MAIYKTTSLLILTTLIHNWVTIDAYYISSRGANRKKLINIHVHYHKKFLSSVQRKMLLALTEENEHLKRERKYERKRGKGRLYKSVLIYEWLII